MSDKEEPASIDLTAFELEDLLGLFIGILSDKAWQYMGVRLAPGKKEAAKDLAKARLTIDCVSYLTNTLAPSLSTEAVSKLRSNLADIQLNYVKQA